MPSFEAVPVRTICAASLLILVSCTTSGPDSSRTGTAPRTAWLLSEPGDDLRQAQRLIDAGRYHEAIPQLQQAIMKAPESEAGKTGRYLLSVTYAQISNYRDAIDMVTDYLLAAPDGRYADEAQALRSRLESQYRQLYPTPDQLEEEIAAFELEVANDPESVDKRLQLADAYWRRGDYDVAAAIYAKLINDSPGFQGNSTLAGRIQFLSGNEYVVLSPQEIQRRQVERQPLVVTNKNAFKSRRDTFTGVPRVYVVTGQVVNRSDSILYGVEVICTIYGFGNVVFDTNTATLGRMYPGETRAFSVRFADFESINDIQRYECHPTFQ